MSDVRGEALPAYVIYYATIGGMAIFRAGSTWIATNGANGVILRLSYDGWRSLFN